MAANDVREKLFSLLQALRPGSSEQTEADRAHDRKVDARTHDMVEGRGLDAEGEIIDFESDSERPPY